MDQRGDRRDDAEEARVVSTQTCYLTLTPKWASWNPERFIGFSVSKVTAKKPSTPGVVVKVILDVDDAAFMPLRPVATVTVGVPDVDVNVILDSPDGDA